MNRFGTEYPQPEGTISALFDYGSVSDRFIAADDLTAYDEVLVRIALIHIASNPVEDEELRIVCATSLGEICWRNKIKNLDFLQQFPPNVKDAFHEEYDV